MKAVPFLLIALGAFSASACEWYDFCHCQASDGSYNTVFTTNNTIRIVFANSIRDYFNRPDLLDYSNSRVFAE